MQKTVSIIAGLSLMLLVACSSKQKTMTFADTQDSQFKPGQVWKYKTRPNETNSTLTVCKVEVAGKLGTVVHVSIAQVKVKSPQNKEGLATEIAHLPFAESAVKQSVTTLANERVALPDYQSGYASWRNAVEGGRGGIWTISVAEAIGAMESALNK